MVTAEQIKADCDVFDRVIARVKAGARAGREIHQDEIAPFFRMADLWKRTAIALAGAD